MKIRRILAAAVLLCMVTAAALGEAVQNRETGLLEIQPASYTVQNAESVFYRALDGRMSTHYQYVAWTSKAQDETPEASLLFNGETLQDIWIRNGQQNTPEDYSAFARVRRMDVDVFTADGAVRHYEFRLKDEYDPYGLDSGWVYGYQRLKLPETLYGVVQVDLWIRGWYKGDVEESQYKVCIADILFSAGGNIPTASPAPRVITPVPVPVITAAPVIPTAVPAPTPTPVPTAEPAPTVFPGIQVSLRDALAARSGPGMQYSELGAYLKAGASVTAFSSVYDEANETWWIQTEFTYNKEKYRVYTEASRLNADVTRIPAEVQVYRNAELIRSVYGYYGPGYGYAMCPNKIPAGTEGAVWQTEGEYAMLEYQDAGTGQYVRVWVPLGALEESNG